MMIYWINFAKDGGHGEIIVDDYSGRCFRKFLRQTCFGV